MKLSQAQFEMVQDAIDARVRGSKRGTPERAAADALSAEWETVLAAPQAKFVEREARLEATAAFATSKGLVQS